MKKNKIQRAVKISTAVYGELIRAYPKAFREKYGPEMAQVFREQCREATKNASGFGLTKLWLRILLDLAKSGSREHIAALGGNMTMIKQALLGRLWLAPLLAFLLIAGLSAVACAYLVPQRYRSTARLQVGGPRERTSDSAPFDPYWFQTQFEAIKSATVLNQVIDDLSLNQRLAARYGLKEPLGREDTLRWLRNQMEILQARNAHVIDIRIFDENSKEAAEIANAIAVAVAQRAPGKVRFVDQAQAELRPVSPNVPRASVGYGLSAAIVSFLVVVVARRSMGRSQPA